MTAAVERTATLMGGVALGGCGGEADTRRPARGGGSREPNSNPDTSPAPATVAQPSSTLPPEVEEALRRLPPGFRVVRASPDGERLLDALASAGAAGISRVDPASSRVLAPPEHSFRAFCLDRYLRARRPSGRVLRTEGSYEHLERMLRQMGYADDDGEPLRPPDWYGQFLPFIRDHPKTAAACENHRRALVWWSAYYGVDVPDETWARSRLDAKEDVASARRAGKMRARTRFFRLPVDLWSLVAADARPHAHPLNRATFRVIAYTNAYAGFRGGEPYHWTNASLDLELGTLTGYQPKDGTYRTAQPPEPHALGSLNDPSLAWYVRHVRPRLDPHGAHDGPDDPLLLFYDERDGRGRPWPSEHAYEQFVQRGLTAILGASARPGPHGWRRACVTLRLRYGWTIEQVANYVGDTPGVVQASYADRAWLNRVGVLRPPKGEERPLVPLLRKGQTFGVPESILHKGTARAPRAPDRGQGRTRRDGREGDRREKTPASPPNREGNASGRCGPHSPARGKIGGMPPVRGAPSPLATRRTRPLIQPRRTPRDRPGSGSLAPRRRGWA